MIPLHFSVPNTGMGRNPTNIHMYSNKHLKRLVKDHTERHFRRYSTRHIRRCLHAATVAGVRSLNLVRLLPQIYIGLWFLSFVFFFL
jgi:hypothetical protein